MRVVEFFTGRQKLKEAREVIREFGDREIVTKTDQKRLDEARGMTRRQFIRQVVAGGLVVAGGSVLASLGLNELFPKRESDDEIRNAYEDAFRKLATGDPQGEELINFYQAAARDGHYEGEGVIVDDKEAAKAGRDFVVAVVDADWDSLVLPQYNSATSYNSTEDILTVRRLKLTDMWKGAVFAYGVSHAYDNLVRQVDKTDEGFYLGEITAYEFGLRLLDRVTGGQLKEIMEIHAKTIPEENIMVGLSLESFATLDSLFPKSLSREESIIRAALYNIGINLAMIESRYKTPEEIKLQNMNYISSFSKVRMQNSPIH